MHSTVVRQLRYGVGVLLLALISPRASAEDPVADQPRFGPAKTSTGSSTERDLIERDWRMQDGIGTPRMARGYPEAIELTLRRGDDVLADLSTDGVVVGEFSKAWRRLRTEWRELSEDEAAGEWAWEALWRRVHALRRRIVLANPLARIGPLVFVKRVPSAFSHQLTQYYGRDARPGGGVFVLDREARYGDQIDRDIGVVLGGAAGAVFGGWFHRSGGGRGGTEEAAAATEAVPTQDRVRDLS